MSKISLYQLSEEERRIEDAIAEGGGELTPELEKALDFVAESRVKKIEAYNHVYYDLDGEEKKADELIRRATAVKRACANGKRRIKENLAAYMIGAGITRMDGETCKVFLKNNPARVQCEEHEVLLPYEHNREKFQHTLPDYIRVEYKLDRTALKNAIEEGKPVMNASLVKDQTVVIR